MPFLDFSGTFSRIDLLVDGAIVTLVISSVSMLIGVVAGTGLALLMGPNRPLRYVILLYIEVIRNTPFLVQIFVVFFGLPSLGLRLSPTTAAIIGLSLYSAAYLAEIVRAGLDSIAPGPIEAAYALGMSKVATFRKVVLTPALAAIFPALTGQFVLILQTSSLLSAISVAELTGASNTIQNLTFRNLEGTLVVAAFYIGLTTIVRAALVGIDRQSFPFKYTGA